MTDIKDLPKGQEIFLVLARKVRGFLQEDEDNRTPCAGSRPARLAALTLAALQLRPWMVLLYEISPGTDILDYELCTEPLGASSASRSAPTGLTVAQACFLHPSL